MIDTVPVNELQSIDRITWRVFVSLNSRSASKMLNLSSVKSTFMVRRVSSNKLIINIYLGLNVAFLQDKKSSFL